MDIRIAARRLARDTRGANMVEYILLVGVVALLCVGAFTTFGGKIGSEIGKQGTAVDGINSEASKK